MFNAISRAWQTDSTTKEDDQHNVREGSGEVDSLEKERNLITFCGSLHEQASYVSFAS